MDCSPQTNQLAVGWSEFARKRHQPGTGHSYCLLNENAVVDMVREYWHLRTPGTGEKDVSRKVLVTVPAHAFHDYSDQGGPSLGDSLFRCGSVLLTEDMQVEAQVTRRQDGEDLFVETFVREGEPEIANYAQVVCYSAEALLENDGERTTDDDWEIVCVIASPVKDEPMTPLTLARNMLEKSGGTKGEYTAQQLAESIYYWSQRTIIKAE